MILRQKEIESVIKLAPKDRYPYLIKRIADQSCLWSIWDNGWAMLGDKEEGRYFPVWPNDKYAELFAKDDWANFKPKNIEIHEFLDKWAKRLKKDLVKIACFPVVGNSQVVVSVDDFVENIQFELSQLE